MKTGKWIKLGLSVLTVFIVSFCLLAWIYEAMIVRQFSKILDRSEYYQLDSLVGHVHSPHFEESIPWHEHPDGSYTSRTNNLGFKEDQDFTSRDSSLLILVTGDSHTDGVCNNSESFPNQLEDMIPNTQFLNGGTGFYSFQQYAGFVEKYKILKPDILIINVYTGNDFIETYLYDKTKRNAWTNIQTFWYRIQKKIFKSRYGLMSSQASAQTLFFKMYPRKGEQAIENGIKHLRSVQKSCKENRIKLMVLLQPSQLDIDKKRRKKVAKAWSEETLAINQGLSKELETKLIASGIETINLLPFFDQNPEGLFWNRDQHLSLLGHRRIAKVLKSHFSENPIQSLEK